MKIEYVLIVLILTVIGSLFFVGFQPTAGSVTSNVTGQKSPQDCIEVGNKYLANITATGMLDVPEKLPGIKNTTESSNVYIYITSSNFPLIMTKDCKFMFFLVFDLGKNDSKYVSPEDMKNYVKNYFESKRTPDNNGTLTINSVTERSGIYFVSIYGLSSPLGATKDGRYLLTWSFNTNTSEYENISTEPKVNLDDFAKCLTTKGAVYYDTSWCDLRCKSQKNMFGDSFRYVNHTSCTEKPDLCSQHGVDAYPTWIINQNKLEGVRSLEQLSNLTGCSLA